MYVLGALALVLNPFFACGSSYSFGVAEVEKALGGTWEASYPHEGEVRTVKFRIEPAAADQHAAREWIRAANACGSRTLVKSAHACVDSTKVPLKLIAVEETTVALGRGELIVFGTSFDGGQLSLRLDGSDVTASISAAGKIKDVYTSDAKLTHAN